MSARSFIVALAVLALIGLLTFGLLTKGSSKVEVGDPVPDKELPVLGGKGHRELADYRGEWVLVNLWASWCGPCRAEAPELERFYRHYQDRDLTVIGINTQDNSEDALAFLDEFDASYPQLRSVGNERSDAFGSTGVPENFLVDPEGRVAFVWPGPVDKRVLDENVVPILEGQATG